MAKGNQDCLKAVEFALDEKWESAHQIVQDLKTQNAQWIHAVLHKILVFSL